MTTPSPKPGQQGIIDLIVLIVVGLLLLNYFGVDLKSVLASQNAKEVGGYIANALKIIVNDVTLLIQFVKDVLSGTK